MSFDYEKCVQSPFLYLEVLSALVCRMLQKQSDIYPSIDTFTSVYVSSIQDKIKSN